jgi:hypothetical protein
VLEDWREVSGGQKRCCGGLEERAAVGEVGQGRLHEGRGALSWTLKQRKNVDAWTCGDQFLVQMW